MMDELDEESIPEAKLVEYEEDSVPEGELDDDGQPIAEKGGVWRDENILVMSKDAELPPRCLKCNEPTDRYLRRNLSWHPSYVYLVVLLNLIIYVIVALIVRKTATVRVPLCARHIARRRWSIAIGWLLFLLGFVVIIGGLAALENTSIGPGPAVIAGILMILVGIFWGILGSQVLTLKKIDKSYVYISKVNLDYLFSLPPMPLYLKIRAMRGR